MGVMERFSCKMAIAPTASISIICGGTSACIEPIPANIYTHKTLSGSFSIKNPYLEKLFNETIAPGESKTVPYTTTAIRTASNDSADEDLSLRAEIDFEAAGGKRTREVFTFPRVGT